MTFPDELNTEELENHIRRIAYALTNNPDDAEDLVSEGLLAALQDAPKYKPGDLSLMTFLLRRAAWRMKDWLRRERKHKHEVLNDAAHNQKIEGRELLPRRVVVHLTEYDWHIIEDCAAEAGGNVTPQDVIRAAVRLLAMLRDNDASVV